MESCAAFLAVKSSVSQSMIAGLSVSIWLSRQRCLFLSWGLALLQPELTPSGICPGLAHLPHVQQLMDRADELPVLEGDVLPQVSMALAMPGQPGVVSQ